MFKKFYKIIFALIAINTISINLNSMQAPNELENNQKENPITLFMERFKQFKEKNQIKRNIVPTITTQDIVPTITAQDIVPTITTQDIVPTITTQDIVPTITTQDIAPNITKHDIKPKYIKSKLSIINLLMLWDIINTIQDINKINILGEVNPSKIKLMSIIELIRNSINFNITFSNLIDNKLLGQAKILYLIPNLATLKFLKNDYKILKDADKIANYNKETKRDLSKTRRNQYAWLAINKLAPYIGFAFARKYNENNSIFSFLTNSEKLHDNSFKTFELLRLASNISERFRKNQLYKAEMAEL